MDHITEIATILMAAGTAYLAWETKRLAKATVDGAKEAERHHQENQRPFCVIEFPGADSTHPFGEAFDSQAKHLASSQWSNGRAQKVWVRGTLQNKGNGPAKDIFVYFNMRRGPGPKDAFRLTRPVLVSGLVGSRETIDIDVPVSEREIMSVWTGTEWKPTQVFHAVVSDTYEIVLEYRDVFGSIFRTVHPRGIWTDPMADMSDDKARMQMMLWPDRPAPIFLVGTEELQTLADFERVSSRH